MIRISFPEPYNLVHIHPNGSEFQDIIEFLKTEDIYYNEKLDAYVCTPLHYFSIENHLETFEDFKVYDNTRLLINSHKFGKSELKSKRRLYRPELFFGEPKGKFQEDDIRMMMSKNRFLNANDTGLGKTRECNVTINHLIADNEIDKILIITLDEALYNWKREILKSSNFKEDDIEIIDLKKRNIEDFFDKKILITSYLKFIKISDFYYKKKNKGVLKNYRKKQIDFSKFGSSRCLVLDEAHKIKNESKTSKIVYFHKEYFEYRYALTKTWIANGIEDGFNIINLLDEGLWGDDKNSFIRYIANVGSQYSKLDIIDYKEDKVNECLDRINNIIVKRNKKEAMSWLPLFTPKPIYIPMTEEFKKIYFSIAEDELQRIKEIEGYLEVKKVFNKFPYMMQLFSDPSLLKGKFYKCNAELEKWNFKNNPKLEICDSIISDHLDESKIIVWSTHPITIDLLAEHYKKYNPLVYSGQTKVKGDRSKFKDDLVQQFWNDDFRKLAIFQPLSLGTAINLDIANIAINWDMTWDSIVNDQSEGRIYRATSTKPMTHYKLILDNTLEVTQLFCVDNKIKLNEFSTKRDQLSGEEWSYLLNGNEEGLKKLF